MTLEEFLAFLDGQAAQAAATMAAATDGASLCSISRTGARVPGVKYPEGRWAALRALRRAARGTAEVPAAIAALRQEWVQDLSLRQERAEENWIAYRLGGVDALDEAGERWAAD